MERKEKKILRALKGSEETYPCVWYSEIQCPIRTKWKLAPENLAPWCTICKEIYLDEARQKIKEKSNK